MVMTLKRKYGDLIGEEHICEGRCWRHFKGAIYQIICVATYSESHDKKLVVYREVLDKNGNAPTNLSHKICARPIEMFISETDLIKYPDAKQKYRFEMIVDEEDGSTYSDIVGWKKGEPL